MKRWSVGFRYGLIAFGLLFFLSIIGLPLPSSLKGIGDSAVPFFAVMTGILSFFALRQQKNSADAIVNSVLIGAIGGMGLAGVTAWFGRMQAEGVNIQAVLAKITPEHTATLTMLTPQEVLAGGNPLGGLVRLVLWIVLGSVAGGIVSLLGPKMQTEMGRFGRTSWAKTTLIALPFLIYGLYLLLKLPQITLGGDDQNTIGLFLLFGFMTTALIALRQPIKPIRSRAVLFILLIALFTALPIFNLTDQFQETILAKIVLYATVGLGLNIILGYAGMLHLGFIVFFAIGAYSYGLLSSPTSYFVQTLGWTPVPFWIGIIVAMLMGGLVSVLIGTTVLRTRGDYLAIVTLGFGQISYLLLLNLREYTGGPGGVLNIPPPTIGGIPLVSANNPTGLLFLALILLGVVVLISYRVRDSRIGRAWIAMKEDHDIAQTMGINLAQTKLLAFVLAGAFAGAAGALYATRQINIFPDNFDLLESVNVLAMVIIGSLGSIEGAILGSVVLIGFPEILRSADEYRILLFGALLVIMMVVRPQGFLPPKLYEEEDSAESDSADHQRK